MHFGHVRREKIVASSFQPEQSLNQQTPALKALAKKQAEAELIKQQQWGTRGGERQVHTAKDAAGFGEGESNVGLARQVTSQKSSSRQWDQSAATSTSTMSAAGTRASYPTAQADDDGVGSIHPRPTSRAGGGSG